MSEKNSHAFIVRIWIEPREIPDAPKKWRGLVQDVFSGDQRYFDGFDQMVDFFLRKIDFFTNGDSHSGKG